MGQSSLCPLVWILPLLCCEHQSDKTPISNQQYQKKADTPISIPTKGWNVKSGSERHRQHGMLCGHPSVSARQGARRGGGPGEGGRGSRGEPPCRNIPNPQGTEKLLENEQLSTWKCHVVGRKQRKFIIVCQFRVPTSHQYTSTTTKQDIHHLMPNDSDLSCQSELDSPVLPIARKQLPASHEIHAAGNALCGRVWPFFVQQRRTRTVWPLVRLKKSMAHAFCASL